MSALLMGQVFYLPIPSNHKIILLALADHAQDDGSSVFPSHRRLALKSSTSERNVRRVIKELGSEGWLIKVSGSAPGKACEYQLAADRIMSTATTERHRHRPEGTSTEYKEIEKESREAMFGPETGGDIVAGDGYMQVDSGHPTADTTGINGGHLLPPNHHEPSSNTEEDPPSSDLRASATTREFTPSEETLGLVVSYPSPKTPMEELILLFGQPLAAESGTWARYQKLVTLAKGSPLGEITRRAELHAASLSFALTLGSLTKRWDELGGKAAEISALPLRERQARLAELRRKRESADGSWVARMEATYGK